MKFANTSFNLGRTATAAALVVGSLFAGQAALACTVDNWSTNNGNVTAGDPNGGAARYAGVCAMQVASGVTGYVQDNNPGGIDRIISRFYLLADNTTAADVYRGFDSGSTQLFNVSVAANGDVTLSSGGSNVTSTNGADGMWNSIEIDWNAGTGEVSLSVNGEPFQTISVSVSGGLDFVRLGNLNAASGTLNFDSYESRRSTFVGRLLVSDANGDGERNSQDIAEMVNELLGSSLAPGQVDCNEDGEINSQDLACIVNILLS